MGEGREAVSRNGEQGNSIGAGQLQDRMKRSRVGKWGGGGGTEGGKVL
jgi:hypothetical protein